MGFQLLSTNSKWTRICEISRSYASYLLYAVFEFVTHGLQKQDINCVSCARWSQRCMPDSVMSVTGWRRMELLQQSRVQPSERRQYAWLLRKKMFNLRPPWKPSNITTVWYRELEGGAQIWASRTANVIFSSLAVALNTVLSTRQIVWLIFGDFSGSNPRRSCDKPVCLSVFYKAFQHVETLYQAGQLLAGGRLTNPVIG